MDGGGGGTGRIVLPPGWEAEVEECVTKPLRFRQRRLDLPVLSEFMASTYRVPPASLYAGLRDFFVRALQYGDESADAMPPAGPAREDWRSARAQREGARGFLMLPRTTAPGDTSGVPTEAQEPLLNRRGEGVMYFNAWAGLRYADAMEARGERKPSAIQKYGVNNRRLFAKQLVADIKRYVDPSGTGDAQPAPDTAAAELLGLPKYPELHAEVAELLQSALPTILHARMKNFGSFAELGAQLRLLLDIRLTLDQFIPEVFSAEAIFSITAHLPEVRGAKSSREDKSIRRSLTRRYLRPGVKLDDMDQAFAQVLEQVARWRKYALSGAGKWDRVSPWVPPGTSEAFERWQRVDAQLADLDTTLGRSSDTPLASLPTTELLHALSARD